MTGLVIALVVLGVMVTSPSKLEERSLSEIQTMISAKEVRDATLFETQHRIEVHTTRGDYQATFLADSGDRLTEQLRTSGTAFAVKIDDRSWLLRHLGEILLYSLLALTLVGGRLFTKLTEGGGLMSRFVGETNYAAERPKERFSDVMGADEAIGSLRVIVNFLRNPQEHAHLSLERGILLEGPTGSGKTLLAKALAGEAGVPYYHLSGSGLSSMFVGGTSQRIELFFNKFKKQVSPDEAAVMFIDELDGIATSRGHGYAGSRRDDNNSVTQFLHQVTSLFDSHPYVVLVGATNQLKALDEAVVRAGRFGLHIAMPNPDLGAREAILAKNSKKLALDAVDLKHVAKLTAGMSGAAVASIPGRAAVLAASMDNNTTVITQRLFEQAAMTAALGTLRHSAVVNPDDLRVSGVHESGHAVLAHLSPHHQLLVVTTIPISDSGGSTWCPRIDRMLMDKDSIMWTLMVALGGREAELLDLKQTSSGPSHDIHSATELALAAVCEWGLYDDFLARIDTECWQEHPRAAEIDGKVQQLLQEASNTARNLLTAHSQLRQRIQVGLREKRILHSDELKELTKPLEIG